MSDISKLISFINGASVGIYGIVLSAGFCNILWTRKKRLLMATCGAGLLLIQGIVVTLADMEMVRYIYPVITHVPLAIVLCFFSRNCLWSFVSVFASYLCCQLRRWLALLIVAIFSGDVLMQNIAELLITVPLMLLLLQFVAPAVRSISYYPKSVQCQFGLIPMLDYGFDYLTRVYTDLLSRGIPVIVEFMFFICSVIYLMSVCHTSKEKSARSRLQQTQDYLNLQMAQAVREIEALRESQHQASTYRHDLRHHMQYLLACIENGCLEQAKEYIHTIDAEIEAQRIVAYCENEAANLILSAFVGRAEGCGITMEIKVQIPRIIPVSESDLCVLLSNGLENALHACQRLKDRELPCSIEVSAYEQNGKFFFQIVNSCDGDVTFENGLPVTNNPGHGLGVKSICTLVERYRGICNFAVKDGKFILRVSL